MYLSWLITLWQWRKSPFSMDKSTIYMAIFNNYFDITRGYPRFLEAFKPQSLQGTIFTATKPKPYPWPDADPTQDSTRPVFFGFVKLQTSPLTGAWKVTDTRTEPTERHYGHNSADMTNTGWRTSTIQQATNLFFERNKTEPFFFRGFLHSRLRHLPLDRSQDV